MGDNSLPSNGIVSKTADHWPWPWRIEMTAIDLKACESEKKKGMLVCRKYFQKYLVWPPTTCIPPPLSVEGVKTHIIARVLLYAPSHRQDRTYHGLCYTSRGALDGMGNSSMDPPWRIDPTTHRTMSERSYHGAAFFSSGWKGGKEGNVFFNGALKTF